MLRDQISNYIHKLHYAGIYSDTQTPANGINLQGHTECTLLCAIGALTNIGGSPAESWKFKLEESEDDSDYSAVGSDDVLLTYGNNDGAISSGVFATIDDNSSPTEENQVYTIGYKGTKQYVRVVSEAENSPGDTAIAVVAVLKPAQRPGQDEG